MTCFSIQKSSFFVLLAFAVLVAPVGSADARKDKSPIPETHKGVERLSSEEELEKLRADAPIVVELFTASDCSACILADRILYDAMKNKNIIALSCHIKDMTALDNGASENPDGQGPGPIDPCVFRQWTFEAGPTALRVAINIPKFYINGEREVGGVDYGAFQSITKSYRYTTNNTTLEVMMRWKDKDTITLQFPASLKKRGGEQNGSVWLIRYKDMEVQKMDAGINKGRVLRFSNIMQSMTHIGKWHGTARTMDVDVTPPQGGNDRGGWVILVGEQLGTSYHAAGKLVDYPVAADLKAESEKRARAKAAAEGKLKAVPTDKAPVFKAPVIPKN